MLSWSALNVFSRACPVCSCIVPWSSRKLLLKQATIRCKKCKNTLTISARDRFINLTIIYLFLSQFNSNYFAEPSSIRELFLVTLVMAFNIPKYLNVLFSLQQVGQTRLKYSKRQNSS